MRPRLLHSDALTDRTAFPVWTQTLSRSPSALGGGGPSSPAKEVKGGVMNEGYVHRVAFHSTQTQSNSVLEPRGQNDTNDGNEWSQ